MHDRRVPLGTAEAAYEIQPSLAGLIPIVEADPALRAGLLSDVPFGTKSMVLTQTLQVWFFQAGAKAQDLRRRLYPQR